MANDIDDTKKEEPGMDNPSPDLGNKTKTVPFTAEQMEIIQKMMSDVRESSRNSVPDAISMYNLRDPKAIETVNVKRIDGMFVLGFKNFQNDPYKKKPKYLKYKKDEVRGLLNEPFITLLLSDGSQKEPIEKEMLLLDYVVQGKQDQFRAKVLDVRKKEVIEDHGFLGSSGEFAVAVDEKGIPEKRPTLLAQTKHEERVFVVELPGFDKPVEFIPDFLA